MKRFYVTKKQVDAYIKQRLKYFDTIEDFFISIDSLLDYLDYKDEVDEQPSTGGNEAQIKFYTRVHKELENLREKATTPQ
jgi:hypothetical protein